jgi:hypothetical protein
MLVTACGATSMDPPRAPVTTSRNEARATAPTAETPNPPRAAPPISTTALRDPETRANEQRTADEREERFSADRQIAELERAVVLYREFIERAGDDPIYAEAVKRSRERIRDISDAVPFLRENMPTR